MAGLPVDGAMAEVHARYTRQGQTDPDAPVRAQGTIEIAAPPAKVWSVLANVAGWPNIRDDIHDVETEGPAVPDLVFTWATSGTHLTSRFGIVVPGRALSWTTSLPGLVMTHVYHFEAAATGTRLNCEETLDAQAVAPQIDDKELAVRIRSWLEGIKAVAEK